jgi:hypothetical protein
MYVGTPRRPHRAIQAWRFAEPGDFLAFGSPLNAAGLSQPDRIRKPIDGRPLELDMARDGLRL